MRRLLAQPLLVLPLLALSWLSPAAAAPVTTIFSLSASGFVDLTGLAAPPVDPASLTLSLTFDPAAGDQFANTAGIALLGTNLPFAGPLAFGYDSANDVLTFGGAGLAGIGIAAGTDDVLIEVDTAYRGAPALAAFLYATSATPGLYESFTGAVAVPEPGTVALLLAAFPLLVRRRR